MKRFFLGVCGLLLALVLLLTLWYQYSPMSFHAHMIHWVFKDIPFIMRMYHAPNKMAADDPVLDRLRVDHIQKITKTISPMLMDDQVAYIKKHFSACNGKQIFAEGIKPGSTATAKVYLEIDKEAEYFDFLKSLYLRTIVVDCTETDDWRARFTIIPLDKGYFMGAGREFEDETDKGIPNKPLTIFRELDINDGKEDKEFYTFARLPLHLLDEDYGPPYKAFTILPEYARRGDYRIRYESVLAAQEKAYDQRFYRLPQLHLFGRSFGIDTIGISYSGVDGFSNATEKGLPRSVTLWWGGDLGYRYHFGNDGCLDKYQVGKRSVRHDWLDLVKEVDYPDCDNIIK